MNFTRSFFASLIVGSMIFLGLTSCDPQGMEESGEVEVKITDAPSDDASVEGVFVTVTEVRIDGETYDGFEGRQTIDVMAYQNGNAKALGLAELEAGTYSNITLVLDTETDADGNAPGCYVMKDDGTKDDLSASGQTTLEVSSDKTFEVTEDATSSIVLDFDLRKALAYESSASSEASFSFVTEAELNAATRAVVEENTGEIEGSFEISNVNEPATVVVYAYTKGSFDKDSEIQGQGASQIMFKNAVSSGLAVKSGNSYSYDLAFLEEGEYEVCIVAYEDNDQDGRLSFDGFLTASILTLGSVTTAISAAAGLGATLSLTLTGLIK